MAVYVLRVVKPEWVDNVYSEGVYYGSVRRVFEPGDTVLFFSKVGGLGDAFIGYGVVESFHRRVDLPEDIASRFQQHPWRWLVRFDPLRLVRFSDPIPWGRLVELGVIPGGARGRCLHGRKLKDGEIGALNRICKI
ncbi:MAG: hypothetical protein NZ955_01100 [Candidatus Bathyarchaeota archaeon]|nr:hypothetical protein [Candidatus Bathyarchaeota archaeon]